MRFVFVCLVTVILGALPATADGIPRFDVESHCEEIANLGGSFSGQLFNGCLNLEQSAYDDLKARWSEIPVGMREHCLSVATFGGNGNYQILGGCIELEQEAATERPSFEF